MSVTIYSRTINGKKSEWEFHSWYTDGMEGGKHREKEYADNYRKTKENNKEYKVEVTK